MFDICKADQHYLALGFLIMRIGIGAIFTIFGFMKLAAGQQQWLWLGSQLAPLGITFLPTAWGFLAANIEFIGGLFLLFGFMTRITALLLALQMGVALFYHLHNGDAFKVYAFPLSLLIVMISICIAGAGHHSIDYYICQNKERADDLSL